MSSGSHGRRRYFLHWPRGSTPAANWRGCSPSHLLVLRLAWPQALRHAEGGLQRASDRLRGRQPVTVLADRPSETVVAIGPADRRPQPRVAQDSAVPRDAVRGEPVAADPNTRDDAAADVDLVGVGTGR